MDPNVVPDQLADENYLNIERLFPKCPPKQANMYSSSSGANKRSFKSCGKDGQRKQTKSKVQQHSRRELEARRNRIKSSLNNDNAAGNSSETSDDNNNNSSSYNSKNLKKNMSLSHSSSQQKSSNSTSKLPQTSSSNNNTNSQPTRKTTKYTAPQSPPQQLQRSQSSYNNNGNNSTTLLDKQQNPPSNNSQDATDKVSSMNTGLYYESRGIVKSVSSFAALLNEPDVYSQSSNTQSSSSSRYHQQSQKSSHDDLGRLAGNMGAKNDNIPSDLSENNSSTSFISSEIKPSILKNSKRELLDASISQALYPTPPTVSINENAQSQIPIIDKPSELINIKSGDDKRGINYREKLFKEKSESTYVNSASTTNSQASVLYAPSNAASSSLTTTTTSTADLGSKDKINHLKRDQQQAIRTEANESTITPSTNQLQTCDDKPILETDSFKKQENTIEGSARRDDDKYINLFVYDNATHQPLQKAQIFSTATPNLEKQPQKFHQQQQQQQQQHQKHQGFSTCQPKGSARYRPPRITRLPGKVADSSVTNAVDESFDSLKNNIEITEIIEEEDDTTTATETKNILARKSSPPSLGIDDASSADLQLKHQQVVENKSPPNIISVHHQASQQLLATSDSNENEDNILRNDASTEELCSAGDHLEEELDVDGKHSDVEKVQDRLNFNLYSARSHQDQQQSETSNANTISKSQLPTHHRALTPISTLQTVDERAEINIEAEFKSENQILDKTETDETSDTMPANQPSLKRKGFVPPGYPQRIRDLKQSSPIVNESNLKEDSAPLAVRGSSEQSTTLTCSLDKDQGLEVGVNSLCDSNSDRSVKLESSSPRVKFDESNLVTVRDYFSRSNTAELASTPDNNKHSTTYTTTKRGTNEHIPQMPSISETQFDSEIDASRSNVDESERDLSMDLNKISLISPSYSQQEAQQFDVSSTSHESTGNSAFFQQQLVRERTANLNIYQSESQSNADIQQQHRSIGLENSKIGQQNVLETSSTNSVTNLRHHKLPNETSHYSMVRSGSGLVESVNSINDNSFLTRSSSLRFNTLSDNESGPEDTATPNIRQLSNGSNSKNMNVLTNTAKKCDSNVASNSSGSRNNIPSTSSSIKTNSINDDDLMPTTKTALIFPRLDEGLSSEAGSCEDEVEEEDERAVDADVDADDDDDYDDDVDDDGENETLPVDRNSSLQAQRPQGIDCFSRQQQSKAQPNRLTTTGLPSTQQHSQLSLMTGDQTELHQVKTPGSAYGGYISQDPLDQNDLKTMTNYSNQNGQSNYWMGVTSQQQSSTLNSQTSQQQQQQFMQRPNHNSNTLIRDEGKVTNRLSSDTDNETDRLLGSQRNDQLKLTNNDVNGSNSTDLQPVSSNMIKQNASSKEVLIEGVLFNVKYLGSTHSDCEGRSEKEDRIHQAEMAVQEVKFRNGESQSATEVQLFISTEKIMVLDDKHRKILMDHSLRTISYIADIGDAIVLIVRKKNSSSDVTSESGRPNSKISCHVFESIESHTITKSISQAFQVAYTELLKANGTGDTSSYLPKELDYQEVLNSQEMSTDELEMFARKENQREVIVPKEKGEILGLSIVESGWGSVLPTVVIANLKHDGPAYRCKRLSIGDQILSVNGISLVGLPLAECQEILRKTKNQRVARLSVVPCPITVEVKIKRPDTKYQLGFSVQNGVICSLLRGGIAERGGVRVGHRIMSINGTTVVGVPHEKIVTLLASSVGEIRMKTCLTSLYRLILGEENPVHF